MRGCATSVLICINNNYVCMQLLCWGRDLESQKLKKENVVLKLIMLVCNNLILKLVVVRNYM